MGDLWGVLFQGGLLLVPLMGLFLVVALAVRFSRRRHIGGNARGGSGVEAAVPTGPHTDEAFGPAGRRAATISAVSIAGSGLCIPWVVGLAVKLYLDSIGEPTYPISGFLDPVSVVVLLGATVGQWCWPFLLLAAWVRARAFVRFAPGRTFRTRLLLAWFTHIVGMIAAVAIFVPVFRRWDIMYIFVPIAFFILVPMVAGYGVGRMALRARDRFRGGSSTGD